jgi:hypothetical protein
MKRFKGTVKKNVVVLEEGVELPDGTVVEVRVPARRERQEARKRAKLKEAVQRILENSITRPIGIDEIIAEMKQELAERSPFEDPPNNDRTSGPAHR